MRGYGRKRAFLSKDSRTKDGVFKKGCRLAKSVRTIARSILRKSSLQSRASFTSPRLQARIKSWMLYRRTRLHRKTAQPCQLETAPKQHTLCELKRIPIPIARYLEMVNVLSLSLLLNDISRRRTRWSWRGICSWPVSERRTFAWDVTSLQCQVVCLFQAEIFSLSLFARIKRIIAFRLSCFTTFLWIPSKVVVRSPIASSTN